MPVCPLKVAWISFFPIEWLPDLPKELRHLPRQHPATWQRVLLEEFQTQPQLRVEVIVVRKHFPRHFSFERGNIRFHCLKVPAGARALTLFWWETILIRRRLHCIGPDLVHAWGSERGAALVASRLGYPYMVSMQGLLEWYATQVDVGRLGRFEARLERVALRRASIVTTESTFAVSWLKSQYPHLDVHQVEHAPNRLFHRVLRSPVTRPIQFLFVGMMSSIKGTDLLLRALDALRDEMDFRLTIVGAALPQFITQLKASTSHALWERIKITAGLSSEQVAGEMARTTMVLFPTRADTSPNSVKEAVVAGVPVVASAVGGIVDYVRPGRNGLLFPAGDLPEFIKAVRAAVNHPLFGRGTVEAAVLEEMRQYLSPQLMGQRIWAAYRSCLAQKQVAVEDSPVLS